MYRTSINYHNKINAGKNPILYAVITTDFGRRVYPEQNFIGKLDFGTYIDIKPRLLSITGLDASVLPDKYDVLTGYQIKKQEQVKIKLADADDYFVKIITKEPFLTKQLEIYLGFLSDVSSKHKQKFSGYIDEIDITDIELSLQAVEL